MGYRSEVTVVCSENVYKNLMAVTEEDDFIPDHHYEMENGDYLIRYEWLKWYDTFDVIQDFMRVLNDVDEMCNEDESDFAVFFRFGEEADDVEVRRFGNHDLGYNYSTETRVGGLKPPKDKTIPDVSQTEN